MSSSIRPADRIHDQTLTALTGLAGQEFASLRDWEERWTDAGNVILSFWLRRREYQIVLPNPGPYLGPALVTGLNSLIPDGHPRFWFHDRGPPLLSSLVPPPGNGTRCNDSQGSG